MEHTFTWNSNITAEVQEKGSLDNQVPVCGAKYLI